MKHAFLIMAHNDAYVLEKLLKLIDYEENDIYLHIDKKSNDLREEEITKWVRRSRLFFAHRMDVRWGAFSIVECQLSMMGEAVNREKYAYYHLLSGVDLPIKKQKELHDFFDEHQGKEFIHYSYHHPIDGAILDRVKIYHFLNKNQRNSSRLVRGINNKAYHLLLRIQKKLNVDRTKGKEYYFGANWCSITDDLVKFILSHKNEIRKEYRFASCSDEIYLQTLIWGTSFYNNLYISRDGDYEACVRYIDWQRGNPYVFRINDFESLMHSPMFFARKFSSVIDKEIVDIIFEKLGETG